MACELQEYLMLVTPPEAISNLYHYQRFTVRCRTDEASIAQIDFILLLYLS